MLLFLCLVHSNLNDTIMTWATIIMPNVLDPGGTLCRNHWGCVNAAKKTPGHVQQN